MGPARKAVTLTRAEIAKTRDHGVGKCVERILVLCLGRLNHQRLVHDQREIVCRRVEVVVHEPLGNVQRADIRSWEAALCTAVLQLGARLLEGLLAEAGSGRRAEPVHDTAGRAMRSLGVRPKTLTTVLVAPV